MDRIFEIIALEDDKIDHYINTRLSKLNTVDSDEEISLSDNEGNIYPNWINTNTIYMPSGNRSKGFRVDTKFIKDFIIDIKDKFGKIPLDKLKARLNEDKLIHWFNAYVNAYFGSEYDEIKRKEIYGYGSWKSVFETLDISELKKLNVARCIEKSAGLNQILNFLDIDSSLVLSKANNVGHAYCLVKIDEKYYVVDPNFYGNEGNGLPYIFEINPHNNSFTFDPSMFGDNEAVKINYSFPSKKVSGIKR